MMPFEVVSGALITGGPGYSEGRVCAIPLKDHDGIKIWEIHRFCRDTSKLLTGKPRDGRPLKSAAIWTLWREAIKTARCWHKEDLRAEQEAKDSAEIEMEGVGAQDSQANRVKKRRLVRQMAAVIQIELPIKPRSETTIQIKVLNNVRLCGMEFSLANLNWLMHTLADDSLEPADLAATEITNARNVSVVEATSSAFVSENRLSIYSKFQTMLQTALKIIQ